MSISVVEEVRPRTSDDVCEFASILPGAKIAEVRDALQQCGVVHRPNLLSTETVAKINAEIDLVFYDGRFGVANDYLGHTLRMNATIRHSPTVATDVVVNPSLLRVAESVLHAYCQNLQLGTAHVAEIHPGEPEQYLHRDDRNWGSIHRAHPLSVISIIALDEFTEETGATRVIPGSHLWDDAYELTVQRYGPGHYEHLEMPALLKRGSAITFLGTTLHGGGANTSINTKRRALIIQYVVGWIRTPVNQLLLHPPEFFKTLPEPVQRLVGFHVEGENLGETETGVDPITLLR